MGGDNVLSSRHGWYWHTTNETYQSSLTLNKLEDEWEQEDDESGNGGGGRHNGNQTAKQGTETSTRQTD